MRQCVRFKCTYGYTISIDIDTEKWLISGGMFIPWLNQHGTPIYIKHTTIVQILLGEVIFLENHCSIIVSIDVIDPYHRGSIIWVDI